MSAPAFALRSISAFALTIALSSPLFAQEEKPASEEAVAPAEESAPEASPYGIEEITITATKRATNIQDVPIAVTAITAEGLQARGIADVKDLQQAAPSLAISDSNSTTNGGTIRIRGMGTSGNNPGLESAVGSFIDGVYRSRSGLALQDLIDVERVEILRGPQGTLFGKNTSAGLIHIITKLPEFEWGGNVSGSVGNFDLRKVQGSVTGPLVEDKLAFRLAGIFHVRDGYYDDIDTNHTFGDRDRWSLKGQLLFAPTDALDFRLIADYTKMREHCCPATYSRIGANAAHIVALGGDAFGGLNDDNLKVGTNHDPQEDVDDWGLSLETKWDFDVLRFKSIVAYRKTDIFRTQDIDFTNADILAPGDTDESWENWSLELQFSGEVGIVDWLAGFYGYTEDLANAGSVRFASQGPQYIGLLVAQAVPTSPGIGPVFKGLFNPAEGRHTAFGQDNKGYSFFTHDIVHVTDRLDLTAGIRYSWERKKGSALHDGTPVGQIFRAPFCDRMTGFAAPLGAGTANFRNAVGLSLRNTISNTCDNFSWADSYTNSELSGTIQAGYALTDDLNVYASASRGFKSGGYNLDADSFNCIPLTPLTRQTPGGPVPNPQPVGSAQSGNIYCQPDDATKFAPEFSTNYELGVKSTWLDGRLVANLAVFHTDFEGFQLNQFTGLGFIIRNVPKVKSNGVELEVSAFPFEGVIGNLSITYADTRYGDGVNVCFELQRPDLSVNRCPTNITTGGEDTLPGGNGTAPNLFPRDQLADGHRITQSPAWTGSLQLSMQRPLFDTGWSWYGGGNAYYRGRHKTSSDLDPAKAEDAHWKLNLQAGVRSPGERLDIQAYASNVTNEIVTTGNFDTVFQSGSLSAFKQPPRMYGVTATYHFGEN